MSLVIDTLHISTITEELSVAEVKILAGLFDVMDHKNGELTAQPDGGHHDSLFILAQGEIEVKLLAGDKETTIHVLKPGDLAGIVTFVGGAPSSHSATLVAKGDTKMLVLERAKFETLINTHPMIVYKLMRGVARNLHGLVRQTNIHSAELSNYIYRTHGRY